MIRNLRILSLALPVLLGIACDVFSGDAKLRVAGATPYVRCLAGPAPDARNGRIGTLDFELRDRSLKLSKSGPLRIGVFSGAGFVAADASALQRLRTTNADIFVLLGGLGDSPALAQESVRVLSSLSRLVLVVLGGRDARGVARDALSDANGHIIDATVLRRVSIGANTLVPWSGAEDGRYALDDKRCGFGESDVAAAAAELGPGNAHERRYLLAWQSPSLNAADPASAGSARLARFRAQIGVVGTLSAWPVDVQPSFGGQGALSQLRVPRLYGPRLELPDTAREALDVAVLEADQAGIRVIH